MKNNKFSKIAIAILTVALCIGAIFAITAGAAGDTDTSAPKIISQNIEYGTDYRLMYAVDSNGITGPVTLTVRSADDVIVYEETKSETEYIKQLDKTVYKFTTQAISHLNMTDCFYVTASSEANGTSETKRYSVAEYLYQRLSDPTASDKQIALYERTIAYGESLQLVVGELDEAADADKLISNFRYVTVEGGKLADGYSAGVYPVGTALAPTKTGMGTWNVANYSAKNVNLGTEYNVTSYTIPNTLDLVGVRFYLQANDGLEGYADWSAMRSALVSATSGNQAVELVEDGDHGKVAKFGFTSGQSITFNKFDTGISAEKATAFVASFDLKVDVKDEANARESFAVRFYDNAGTDYARVQLQFYVNSTTAKLGLGSEDNWAADDKFYTVDTSSWFNVKLVQYDGNKNIYLYVNNDIANPVVVGHADSTMVNANYDISALDRTQLGYGRFTQGTDFYIDNLFFGFTEDPDPTIKKTPDSLESYADWSAMRSALVSSTTGNQTVELVKDGEHGNVAKFGFTSGQSIIFNKFNTGVASETATAFVASFDLKVDVKEQANTRESFTVRFYDASGYDYARVQLQFYVDGTTAKLGLGSEDAWAADDKFYTVDTSSWLNVKLVQYDGNENIYLYVNNDMANPVVVGHADSTMVDANYDISALERTELSYGRFTQGTDFYIDNVFFGFTEDTVQ